MLNALLLTVSIGGIPHGMPHPWTVFQETSLSTAFTDGQSCGTGVAYEPIDLTVGVAGVYLSTHPLGHNSYLSLGAKVSVDIWEELRVGVELGGCLTSDVDVCLGLSAGLRF